jgi:peptidoglycan/xylan/chitin deacetylase (PgdA/CDA1 family)
VPVTPAFKRVSVRPTGDFATVAAIGTLDVGVASLFAHPAPVQTYAVTDEEHCSVREGVVDQDRRLTRRSVLAGSLLLAAGACGRTSSHSSSVVPSATASAGSSGSPAPAVATPPPTSDPAVIARRATVPVLCWHQIRDWRPSDSAYDRAALICPPAIFRAQLDTLRAAGCTTITPDQYLMHLRTGTGLPAKPVLLTFDDAQGSQATVAFPELQRRSMTATFFAMTVVLDKPNWMSRQDLRRLDRAGMTIAAHTYDHHRADRYTDGDWRTQVDEPRAELESIIGKPVRHFAYPYGAWSPVDFPHLTAAGYQTAFQLSDRPMDRAHPLLTLRRQLVNSSWTGPQLIARLGSS